MYAHFKGTIDSKFSDRIILDVNDIGYEIYMPESEILSLEDNKNKVKIYTYLNVREDRNNIKCKCKRYVCCYCYR